LKLGCWFWRRRFLKFFSVFLLFCDYLPLEKGNPLLFNNLESPPPKDDLHEDWLKLAQWFRRRSRKCKSLQTDGQTDGRRTTEDQNSSLELSAQVSEKNLSATDIGHTISQNFGDLSYDDCMTFP
jgi:hypothetical protein